MTKETGEKAMICDNCGKRKDEHTIGVSGRFYCYKETQLFKPKPEQPTQENCGCDLEVNYLCKKHGEEKQAYSAVHTQAYSAVQPTQLPKRPEDEDFGEQLSRVEMMATDAYGNWDLSDNDTKALSAVVAKITELELYNFALTKEVVAMKQITVAQGEELRVMRKAAELYDVDEDAGTFRFSHYIKAARKEEK